MYAYVIDSANGPTRRLERHGERVASIAIDPTGTIVATGDADGLVRVGRVTGEEPHLLYGHRGPACVAISPRGDWLASGAQDTTVRLWPMPDFSKPPAHRLPLPELLARLKAQTNVRLIADPTAPGGHRTELGPFPGWADVPAWEP
jgi:WD40 repeat protein